MPESAPAPAPPITPAQPPTSPFRPLSPSGNAVLNEDGIIATGDRGGLQRTVSLFRTPSVSRNNDHGEQLPAFSDVALPQEMVPHDRHQQTSPPLPLPQSPPPPHTFSAPSGPPSFLHNVRPQAGPASPPLIIPQSPPPPHTFSAPARLPPSLHNIPPPPPPPLISSPLSLSPATTPTSPTYTDPPPAFIPSNSHYPPPEKPIPYVHQNPGNARVISNPMSIYTSANRTHTQPAMKFDLEAAYGRRPSPGLPQDSGASLYRLGSVSLLDLCFSIIPLVPRLHRPWVGDNCRGLPEGGLEPPNPRGPTPGRPVWMVSQVPIAFLPTQAPMHLTNNNLINRVVFTCTPLGSNRTDRINPRRKTLPGIISTPTMA